MRAGTRSTSDYFVAVGSILCLTFGALVIILAVCAYQWRQNNLRYAEFMDREKSLSESFQNVYQKLMENRLPATTTAFIRPCDIRKALARGPNDLGELPPWVDGEGVYIPRADVPVSSGGFICFIRATDTNATYGLTSAGACSNATVADIFSQDFVSLRPADGHSP